ncbi:MAG: helix-turn-helix transcriptional regulator [Pseudomonadota bacterium]
MRGSAERAGLGFEGTGSKMEPTDFKKWRKAMHLSQKDAAHALGLKRRMIQYYEKGERDGEKVKIPRSVRLACYAIAQGIEDYHGPTRKLVVRETEDA